MYENPGDRETILFIHGIGASSWMWWQQLPAFSDYDILNVDLPGHGKNAAIPWTSLEATTDFIAKQIPKPLQVHVVGISLGGHVALELAKRYPEKLLSVFISGITVKPMPFQFLLKVQSYFVQQNIQNKKALTKLARKYYHLPADKIPEFIANYQLLTRKTYETIAKEIMQFCLDETYGSINVPSLIVAGDQESKGILESVRIAPKTIPTTETKLIPNAPHAWPVQNAKQFNQVLRDWLSKNKHSI